MSAESIIPNYKMLVSYDIRQELVEQYYYYVLKEFVPELESMGLYMFRVWHVAYGNYPVRQIEFVSESLDTIHEVLNSERFEKLESTLREMTRNYERKVIRFKQGYQF